MLCLLLILFPLSLGCAEECDPYAAWVGDWDVWVIEGVPKWYWIENQLNSSAHDRLTSGVRLTSESWRFTFQSDGNWYSAISASGLTGLASSVDISIVFDGTYTVTEDRYELKIGDIKSNVGSLDISAIIEFMESQLTGSWESDGTPCHILPKLSRFGKFTVY